MMRCEDVADQLTNLMEGDLPEEVESAALQHLATCPRCETVLAETRNAVQVARDHGRVGLSEDDRARMLAAIVDERSAQG